MPDKTKVIPIKFKAGDPLLDDAGQPKTDENGVVLRGAPVPVKTVEIKNLTSSEAMDADDFAVAISPTGNPSRSNLIRSQSLCAVRKIDNETILRPRDLESFTKLRDKFDVDELHQLAVGKLAFDKELNAMTDPLNSPGEAQSPQ